MVSIGAFFDLEKTPLPRISISQLSNSLQETYTCFSRSELGFYQIDIFGKNYDEAYLLLNKVEDIFDRPTTVLQVKNRLTEYNGFSSSRITEIEPGIFQCSFILEVQVQKQLKKN